MGPPSRPAADKPTDINELGDVLAGSGVDLREEEAALLAYGRPGQQRQDPVYSGSSFNSFGPSYSTPVDNFYSSNVPGDRNSFYGAGTFNQPAATYISAEEIAAAERKKALRRRAEIRSYHLNDPFLFAGPLSRGLLRQAQNMQVQIPQDGLSHNVSRQNVLHQLLVHGPDKNENLKLVKGESVLSSEGLYVEILSLLSLATEERMRGLVEDAAALAKGRRIGSHGIVPVDLIDLATGEGATETANGLPTPGNSAVSPKSNPLKRTAPLSLFLILILTASQALTTRSINILLRLPAIQLHLPPFNSLILLCKLSKRSPKTSELKRKNDLRSVDVAQPKLM